MNGYFSMYTESHEGDEGVFYCEVQDGLIIRHVSVFGDVYYWATPKACFNDEYDFTDQPEFNVKDSGVKSISKMDFEVIWENALSQGNRV